MKNCEKKSHEIKIDLDIKSYKTVLFKLNERLSFMLKRDMIDKKNIKDIKIIQKERYSCKIILHEPLNNLQILVYQAILGDDWKRICINYYDLISRDIENWNRLFEYKKYADGTIKTGTYVSIKKKLHCLNFR